MVWAFVGLWGRIEHDGEEFDEGARGSGRGLRDQCSVRRRERPFKAVWKTSRILEIQVTRLSNSGPFGALG